jgi:hypothetical protein
MATGGGPSLPSTAIRAILYLGRGSLASARAVPYCGSIASARGCGRLGGGGGRAFPFPGEEMN